MFKQIIKAILPRSVLEFGVRQIRTLVMATESFSRSGRVKKHLNPNSYQSLSFFSREEPSSTAYPYITHFPGTLENAPDFLRSFHIVGRNWIEAPNKPIALAIGFNDWKLGFVAEYFPEYRMAFARGGRSAKSAKMVALSPEVNAQALVVWGYKDPEWVSKVARKLKVPLLRVEDGFVRSANLGAAHVTPYSLIVDSGELHFNNQGSGDLSRLLNNYDFDQYPELLEKARTVRQLLVERNISKYNLPSAIRPHTVYRTKTRKRVLVIGQVDKDEAVRLGNPDKWNMLDLIRMARLENPDAEILYRPHPEIYKGYQKSIFRNWKVSRLASVIPPNTTLLQSLEGVDEVYTISSLSGLEALMRGIKVVTFGTPFYAGWGLTEDRTPLRHRDRNITLDELVACVYLLYPRYMADLDNSYAGLRAAVMRIEADRTILELNETWVSGTSTSARIRELAQSDLWPRLILDPNLQQPDNLPNCQKAFLNGEFERSLRSRQGSRYRIALTLLVAGWLDEVNQRDKLLATAREVLEPDDINVVLLHLSVAKPGAYLSKHFAWLLSKHGGTMSGAEYVRSALETIRKDQSKAQKSELGDGEDSISVEALLAIENEESLLLGDLLSARMSDTDYSGAEEAGFGLLARGVASTNTLLVLAKVAEVKFDFVSTHSLCSILMADPQKGVWDKAVGMKINAAAQKNQLELEEDVSLYLALKPDKIVNSEILIEKRSDLLKLDDIRDRLYKSLDLNRDFSIPIIQSLIARNKLDLAVQISEQMVSQSPSQTNLIVAHSQALSFSGRVNDARAIIEALVLKEPIPILIREALRLCVLAGDYESASKFLELSQSRAYDVGDMLPRKVHMGARNPGAAHDTFRHFHLKKEIAKHYPQKYALDPANATSANSLLLLPIFGPGDEIRFATIYNMLGDHLPHNEFVIACSPRLQALFQRSFPDLKCIPVDRVRNTDRYSVENYNRVASSTLVGALDNTAIEQIDKTDEFCLATDLLATCLPDYESFQGQAYLKADPAKISAIKKRLPTNTTLVGISWRSSLNTHSRNEHYLSIQELAPILAIDNVQFVNFQYDDCSEELAWAEKNFPGKIINLQDIDQFNDFDSVAAMMKCMDLIISPATTVVELAGALGCPTWLLSNSSELHWRKVDEAGTDVWHNSITHVEGARFKDKVSLIAALSEQLHAYLAKPTFKRPQSHSEQNLSEATE